MLALSFFAARYSNGVDQVLLLILFIGIIISFIPALHPQARIRIHSYALHPSKAYIIAMLILIASIALFYNSRSADFITRYIDSGSMLFIGYVITSYWLSFREEDHIKALIMIFILTFSYFFIGYEHTAETTGALFYLLLGWVAVLRFVKTFRMV